MLEQIQNKTNIDIKKFSEKLEEELYIICMLDSTKKKKAKDKLLDSIYEVMLIILDTINQSRIPDNLYTTWKMMVKDYWFLNKYDKTFVFYDRVKDEDAKKNIKSIQIGDTTTSFLDTSSQIEINGIAYNVGTINFDEDILVEKYKKQLYKHRKMRW